MYAQGNCHGLRYLHHFNDVCLSTHGMTHAFTQVCSRCPKRTGFPADCEPPDAGAGNQTPVLWKGSKCSPPSSHRCSLHYLESKTPTLSTATLSTLLRGWETFILGQSQITPLFVMWVVIFQLVVNEMMREL